LIVFATLFLSWGGHKSILFENHIDLFTGVQFSVDKPKALGNMTDIIYALNVYLTGDAGDKTIQVTGFIEEE